jgi:hypothetical protein
MGAVLPGVTVHLKVDGYERSVTSDATGSFIFFDVPHGQVELTSTLTGFATSVVTLSFDGSPRRVAIDMSISQLQETITVSGDSPAIDTRREPEALPPSQNVVNLQQRAAGVLPIRVDVPRAGMSHQFVKPLVVDTVATVTLRYKRN